MKLETFEMRKITASEGMVLTNGEAYGKEVYLGCNDSQDNWHEITDEEYKEILDKQQEDFGIIEEE